MEKINSIDDVLKRVEGIRDSLKFSEEIFPLLSDLFVFLKEILPLMMEANVSMRESTSGLPDASGYLNKVSATTEMATFDMMDKLDKVMASLDSLSDSIENGGEQTGQLDNIEEIRNEANAIMMALQFQDITTQQLEHTQRILQAVHEKFSALIHGFGEMKAKTLLGADVLAAIDGEVERHSAGAQRAFFEERTQDLIRNNGSVSQEDIDNLFK